MSQLFQPLRLGGLELANRITIAPMCQYSAEDGRAGDWHMIHHGSLALSGAGLLILEATAISPEGRISPADLGLYSDEDEEALARVLRACRANSPMPIAIHRSRMRRPPTLRRPVSEDWLMFEFICRSQVDGAHNSRYPTRKPQYPVSEL